MDKLDLTVLASVSVHMLEGEAVGRGDTRTDQWATVKVSAASRSFGLNFLSGRTTLCEGYQGTCP